MDALSELPGLAGLRSLNLGSNELGPQAAEAIGMSEHLDALEVVTLSGNRIDDAGLGELLSRPGRRYRGLYLSRNEISSEGLGLLAEAECCRSLERLALGEAWACDEGVRRLIESPVLERLRWIELSQVDLSSDTINALRQRFETVRL